MFDNYASVRTLKGSSHGPEIKWQKILENDRFIPQTGQTSKKFPWARE
jgi:hypothetical protein